MKKVGNFILLAVVDAAIRYLGGFLLLLIFVALLQTTIGTYFVGHLTGWMPDVAAVYAPAISSFFVCTEIAVRRHAEKQIRILGTLIVLANLVFGISNFFHGEPLAANIIYIILGIVFVTHSGQEAG